MNFNDAFTNVLAVCSNAEAVKPFKFMGLGDGKLTIKEPGQFSFLLAEQPNQLTSVDGNNQNYNLAYNFSFHLKADLNNGSIIFTDLDLVMKIKKSLEVLFSLNNPIKVSNSFTYNVNYVKEQVTYLTTFTLTILDSQQTYSDAGII